MSLHRCLATTALAVTWASAHAALGAVWYLDDDAPPSGDGLTWPTAFNFPQDALAVAQSGDEIRVAEGTYRPDESATSAFV